MLVQAIQFATEMHKGQVRKYTGEPYVEHPIAVADLVEEYLDANDYSDEDIIYAMVVAVLHDTVEDTVATIETIAEIFGEEVAKGVWFLTKAPDFVGVRAERKALCRAKLAAAPRIIQIIKTFDMKHNSLSIKQYDPKFWDLFQKETDSLLSAMKTTEIF